MYDDLDDTSMVERSAVRGRFMVRYHQEGSRIICASLLNVVDKSLGIRVRACGLRGWTSTTSITLSRRWVITGC